MNANVRALDNEIAALESLLVRLRRLRKVALEFALGEARTQAPPRKARTVRRPAKRRALKPRSITRPALTRPARAPRTPPPAPPRIEVCTPRNREPPARPAPPPAPPGPPQGAPVAPDRARLVREHLNHWLAAATNEPR